MNVAQLEPRRHAPPEGWSAATFGAVTSALAGALVAAIKRRESESAGAVRPRRLCSEPSNPRQV